MRFFHISDLHIGLKLINRDLYEDQKYILQQIVEAAAREQPDAVVVAGDIYDRSNPSAEAVELFDHFVTALAQAIPEAEIMMISGNHDSPHRINLFRNMLGRQHLHMIGLPPCRPEEHIEKVTWKDEFGPVNFYLLPFVRPSMVQAVVKQEDESSALSYDEAVHRLLARETINESERNVLVSHQFYIPRGKTPEDIERMDSEIRTVGNIDEVGTDLLERFDYAALGHIHKPMQAGGQSCRYCGTPLACSVSEAGQQKAILSVTMGVKGEVEITSIPLTPLREVRILRGTLAEVLEQGCKDYVTVCLTDKVDLDTIDMQDRLNERFPYLLEIRRENIRGVDYSQPDIAGEDLAPFELCCAYLKDLNEEEKELLRDVVNAVQEDF